MVFGNFRLVLVLVCYDVMSESVSFILIIFLKLNIIRIGFRYSVERVTATDVSSLIQYYEVVEE